MYLSDIFLKNSTKLSLLNKIYSEEKFPSSFITPPDLMYFWYLIKLSEKNKEKNLIFKSLYLFKIKSTYVGLRKIEAT